MIEAGEPTDLTRSQLVEDTAELAAVIDPQVMRVHGRPRLVLERGFEEALRAALESLDPDRLRSPEALVDAVEAAARIQRWAVGPRGRRVHARQRAAQIGERALGRLAVYSSSQKPSWASSLRLAGWAPVPDRRADAKPACPSTAGTLDEDLDALEAEPGPVSGAALSCWDAFVTTTIDRVLDSGIRS